MRVRARGERGDHAHEGGDQDEVKGVALVEHCPPRPQITPAEGTFLTGDCEIRQPGATDDRQPSRGRQDEFDRVRSVHRTTNRADPRDVDDAAQLGALDQPLSRARSSGARAGLAGPRRRTGRDPSRSVSAPGAVDHRRDRPLRENHPTSSTGRRSSSATPSEGCTHNSCSTAVSARRALRSAPARRRASSGCRTRRSGPPGPRCTTRSARTTSHPSQRSSSTGASRTRSAARTRTRSTSATTSPGPHVRSSRPATRTSTRTQRRRSITGIRTGRRSSWSREPRTASARLRSTRRTSRSSARHPRPPSTRSTRAVVTTPARTAGKKSRTTFSPGRPGTRPPQRRTRSKRCG